MAPAGRSFFTNLGPARLVAAIVDRVTYNAHIIETGTQSYRVAASKTTAIRKRTGRREPALAIARRSLTCWTP
jgi:hypothetical protein